MPPPNHLKRLAWLLACFFTDLAIPALIAAGWLFVADPTKCEPQQRQDAP